jgi:type I restriction enzyme S subunit
LRLTALRGGRVALQERKVGAWTAKEAQPFLVQEGDFFVARGNGSLGLVGRGALVEDPPDPVAFPDTMIRLRLDPQRIRPQFLRLIWDSPLIRRQLEGSARTTAGIYKVNQKDLRRVMIPLPHLEIQDAVLDAGGRQITVLERAADIITTTTRRSESLRRSILAQAFTGSLVAQAPDDEAAYLLLNRIASATSSLPPGVGGLATGASR